MLSLSVTLRYRCGSLLVRVLLMMAGSHCDSNCLSIRLCRACQGTLAREILAGPKTITSKSGARVRIWDALGREVNISHSANLIRKRSYV